jgi:hypothetical protein
VFVIKASCGSGFVPKNKYRQINPICRSKVRSPLTPQFSEP